MATRKQLRERWFEGAGRERLDALIAWLRAPGPQSTDDLPALLVGLPFRDEVPDGRDLRGMPGGFLKDVDLSGWDMSFSRDLFMADVDFTGGRLDGADLQDPLHGTFRGAGRYEP